MRIGEFSEKSGLSRDTIRFYERNGLITSTEAKSETNNYRHYSDKDLVWLEFVTRARESGLSIADLRGIVEAIDGRCDRDVARAVFLDKIGELRARAEQIKGAIEFLERALDQQLGHERGKD